MTDSATGPSSADWDPSHYLRFSDERSRPFVDLLARVPGAPRTVLDLGCGPGHLVAAVHARWPGADVTGVDASPAMVEQALAEHGAEADFVLGDLATYAPDDVPDLVVSNAAFQWVPDHLAVLARWRDLLAGGSSSGRRPRTLAVQVPGNQDAPSHVLLRELAATPPYARFTAGTDRAHVHRASGYLEVLAQPGWTVDAWETTYLHVLAGPGEPADPDPVFTWISATGARPVLAALPDDLRPAFVEEYKARLREAYPARPFGTVLPFRRTFAVATRD